MFKLNWKKIRNGKGSVGIPVLLVGALAAIIVVSLIPTIGSLNTRTALSMVKNAGYVVFAAGEYEDLNDRLDDIETTQADDFGASATGLAITETLLVSPNGNSTDGETWATAYSTIQAALDVASIDTDDCTLILVSPHTSFYDINTTGDPTWTGNYDIRATHRSWSVVRNTHGTATSIFKFTGKVAIQDLVFSQTGTLDGVIFTNSGYRVKKCVFNSSGLAGAATSLHIDGTTALILGGRIEDVEFDGHVTHTTAMYFDKASTNNNEGIHIHTCLTGIQIVDATSTKNTFVNMDIGESALGFDIDAGGEQHFIDINFHHNTINVDDEVGNHQWKNITGQLSIEISPDDFTGVSVPTDAVADTWGTLTTVYTSVGHGPFRVVGSHLDPAVSQWYRVRFFDGTTYFDDHLFDSSKREGQAASSGTEFIFNEGTVIQAQSKCESAGPDGLIVWLEIQEIN